MSQKFQASVHHRDDVSYVKLSGVIDEDNELTTLTDKIPAGTAVIDLGEIERINSCGVRDWVNWLGKLQDQATRAVLVVVTAIAPALASISPPEPISAWTDALAFATGIAPAPATTPPLPATERA